MRERRVLLVGAGGVGAPVALSLARAGVGRIVIADDDEVEASNLHRQILFADSDVGEPKGEALARAIRAIDASIDVVATGKRFLPETAGSLLEGVDVVIDGVDNFASRFLVADACHLRGVRSVHGAAVRLVATCFVGGPGGRPCYRCLFEDIPEGPAPDCATAGVLGPVCGVAGALAADAALRIVRGDTSLDGTIASFDAKRGRFRRVAVRGRSTCVLCGDLPAIASLERARYAAPACDVW